MDLRWIFKTFKKIKEKTKLLKTDKWKNLQVFTKPSSKRKNKQTKTNLRQENLKKRISALAFGHDY